MSQISVARVPTLSASRYLQQLAKYWSHRFDVDFSPEAGTIAFSGSSRLEMRADSETLDLVLTVPDGEDMGRMREVVERHLDRFAFREGELTYDWREAD